MKINFIARLFLPALITLAAFIFTGCKTTPPVDWNSRVGTYTQDQAVSDFGPPDKQAVLSDGNVVDQWITHRSGGSGFSVGTGFGIGGAGVGMSQSTGSGYRDKVLTLTFGKNNLLVAWSDKN